MKITDLHVERFGAWRGLSLRELPDKLTLIYGPNEAGKTTLLQFVRTVLYGFSAQRYHRYVPAEQQLSNAKQKALRTGGCLRLSTAEGNYWVRRYAKSSDPLDGPGELRLTSDDGAVQTEARFDALLSGIDESIFNNVFALGLGELQQLGTLNDTQAAQQLYRLSTGVDRVSLADVVGELQAARTGLLAEDERA